MPVHQHQHRTTLAALVDRWLTCGVAASYWSSGNFATMNGADDIAVQRSFPLRYLNYFPRFLVLILSEGGFFEKCKVSKLSRCLVCLQKGGKRNGCRCVVTWLCG